MKGPRPYGANNPIMSLSFQERFKDRTSSIGKQGELVVANSTPVNKSTEPGTFTSSIPFSMGMSGPSQTAPFANFQPRVSSDTVQFVRPIRITSNRIEVRPEDSVTNSRMTPATIAATEPLGLGEEYKRVDMKTSLASFGSVPVTKAVALDEKSKNEGRPPVIPRPRRPPKQPKSAQLPQPKEETPVPEKPPAPALSEKAESVRSSPSQLISAPKERTDYTPYTLKDYHAIKTNKYLELGGLGAFMIGTEEWQKKKELHDKRKSYARQVLQSNANRIALSLSRPRVEKSESAPLDSRSRALDFARKVHPPAPRLRSVEAAPKVFEEPDRLSEMDEEHLRLRNYVEEMKARLMS